MTENLDPDSNFPDANLGLPADRDCADAHGKPPIEVRTRALPSHSQAPTQSSLSGAVELDPRFQHHLSRFSGDPAGIGYLIGRRRHNPQVDRIASAVIGLACLAVLVLASLLTPSPTGVGTHTELGAPFLPCIWLTDAHMPCPTCGMTTAFAHAANGNLGKSFLTQPAGCILAILTAMSFWVCLYVTITGSPIGRVILKLWNMKMAWIAAAIIIAAWGYKIWIMHGTF